MQVFFMKRVGPLASLCFAPQIFIRRLVNEDLRRVSLSFVSWSWVRSVGERHRPFPKTHGPAIACVPVVTKLREDTVLIVGCGKMLIS